MLFVDELAGETRGLASGNFPAFGTCAEVLEMTLLLVVLKFDAENLLARSPTMDPPSFTEFSSLVILPLADNEVC